MRTFLIPGALVIAGAMSAPAIAATTTEPGDLSGLSIEELANIEVRSASKREESLNGVPTALYVLTPDDIESAGATSLPEALRLAPNLWVQQMDASQYQISARGFNGAEAGNKVLALIDGRTIYTPLGSSVFWNLHSPILEDLEQIEVISGPGGTLYGPNAVNGVINITTRDAQDTLGTLVRGTIGGEESTAAVRQGFAIGGSGAVRVYANAFNRDGLPGGAGPDYDDDYRGWQAGFRSDFVNDRDHLTFQGDIYRTDADTLAGDGARGHNLLGRWSRTLDPNTSFQFQTYYDSFKREFLLVQDSVDTIDAEGQLNLTRGRHELVAGAGVRTTKDEFINDLNVFNLDPTSKRLWVYNAFVQDRLRVSDTLSLIAGVKVERSSFSGFQLLPNARVAWQPNAKTLLWAAVSRAVRTPSRIDRDLQAPMILATSPNFESEKLVAVEAGYRGQPFANLNLSVNGFLNFYDDIRTTELTDGGLPIQLRNGLKGRTYGIEAWATTQPTAWWRLSVGTATLWKDFHVTDGQIILSPRNSLGNDPNWQVRTRSEIQLSPKLQLEINARAVGDIDQAPKVKSYVEAGGRLAYQATDRIELFVAGRNLLHKTHIEHNDPGQGQAAERSVIAGTRLRF
jgi:iron complex outermembrane receptor protein